MGEIIKLENISSGYGKTTILHSLNFKVKKGEFFGIIGPNGSGKSTLLKSITGTLKPTAGDVYFKQENISQISPLEYAKNIAVVSQAIEAVDIKVRDYLLLGRYPYRQRFQFFDTEEDIFATNKILADFQMDHYANSYISELSGGEKQIIQIAKALNQDPSVILLDEPTAHLDITHQMFFLDLLRRLNKDNKLTVIVVLHDLNCAAEYCQKLLLLNKGKISALGKPEEVLQYKKIEEVYQVPVVVKKSPLTGKPFVYTVPEDELNRV